MDKVISQNLATYTQEETLTSLKRSLRRKKGFGLFFVQCSPRKGQEIIQAIKTDLPDKKVAVLNLEQEINNLYNLIEEKEEQLPIDILFIQGLEKSLEPYTKAEPNFKPPLTGETRYYGGEGTYYRLHEIPPILAHLNLQRERFKERFDFCLVFLLPRFALKYIIRRAPDLFDWRSGVFEFVMDQESVKMASLSAIYAGQDEEYVNLTPEQRYAKIIELQDLIEEPYQNRENQVYLWLEIGLLYIEAQDYLEALASFDQALKINPDDDLVWNNRGIALGNLGRYEEALASFDQALKFNPNYYVAWKNRVIALGNLGRYEEALASFDQALKFKPNDYKTWVGRGIALGNLGRYEEALASFDQALKIKPSNYKTWDNRGVALGNLGRYEEALASFDQALKINPNDAHTLYNKACCYGLQGNTELAIENLKQAINLDEKYRDMAKKDTDFDRIRNNETFQKLLDI